MNHYPHHIGDYLKDAGHLSLLEHGCYRRMLDVYYTRERPFLDNAEACKLIVARTKEERAAVALILTDFFAHGEDGWRQGRADEEIAAFRVGEPEREVKKSNEALRLQRHREERASLFQQLNAAGQHADWNIKMADLRDLVQRHQNKTATLFDQPETQPATATATPDTANQNQNQNQGSKPMSGKPDDRALNAQAVSVIEFLNESAGKRFQAVPANVKLVVARLREGASPETCKQVVSRQVAEWANDSKMQAYLRPETLFNATKFAQYVGELGSVAASSEPLGPRI